MIRQSFRIYQKMHKKIPHILILILRARINAEKRYAEKKSHKMDLTGVEIAWVDVKSNKYPFFIHVYKNDQRKTFKTLGDFEYNRFLFPEFNLQITYKSGQHRYLMDHQHLDIEAAAEEILQKYCTNRKPVSMFGL